MMLRTHHPQQPTTLSTTLRAGSLGPYTTPTKPSSANSASHNATASRCKSNAENQIFSRLNVQRVRAERPCASRSLTRAPSLSSSATICAAEHSADPANNIPALSQYRVALRRTLPQYQTLSQYRCALYQKLSQHDHVRQGPDMARFRMRSLGKGMQPFMAARSAKNRIYKKGGLQNNGGLQNKGGSCADLRRGMRRGGEGGHVSCQSRATDPCPGGEEGGEGERGSEERERGREREGGREGRIKG
eukprot:664381-Rhodomonas_salina.1